MTPPVDLSKDEELNAASYLVEEGEEEFANERRVGSVSSRVVLGSEVAAVAAGATVVLPQLQLSVSKSVPDLTAAVHAAAAYNAAAPWHTPSHTRPPYAAPVGVSHAPATATPTNQYSSPGSVSQLPNEYLDVQTEQAGYQQHQRTPGHRGAGIPPSRDTPTTTLLLPTNNVSDTLHHPADTRPRNTAEGRRGT